MSTKKNIVRAIEILGYATIPHLLRFIPESKRPDKTLHFALMKLVKDGGLKRRTLKAPCEFINKTIYFFDDPEINEPKEWQHQFALKDVEASFLYHYGFIKGYEVFITDKVRLKYWEDKKARYYRPDAFMRINADKTFDYYIELERSRKGMELTNKMRLSARAEYQIPYKTHTENDQPLFSEPLSKQSKFLYVIASKQSDCYARPPYDMKRQLLDSNNIPSHNIPVNVLCTSLFLAVDVPASNIWLNPATGNFQTLIY